MSIPDIKKLIDKILNHFHEKEQIITDKQIRYYCNNEFDSNQTEFEKLSNQRALVLKSKLHKNEVSVIMSIFNALYSKNFWIFEDNEYQNIDEWIEFLLDNFDGTDMKVFDQEVDNVMENEQKIFTIMDLKQFL